MNQVQEMPRLVEPARLPDAIERLSGLFERMKLQPGFLSAEVLQNVAAPQTLLVLHTWRDLRDWQTYQNSPEKLAFTASRPEGLYEMVECGMNWRSLQADGAREGDTLRREVIRHRLVGLRSGSGISGCQTLDYQDDLPAFAGCSLRLTRLADANAASDPAPDAIVDETYRSLLSVKTAMTHPAENAAGA
jgi:heme-degrading monooxygenase HmoA